MTEKWQKIDKSIQSGICSEHEIFSVCLLSTESKAPREIWDELPIEYRQKFKAWLSDCASRPDLEFMTNNYIVKPMGLVQSFTDFLNGKIPGDTPVKDGAIWVWFGGSSRKIKGS